VTDCELDASALVLAIGGKGDDAAQLRSRLTGMRRHAPHLIDAEVANVIRRHEREGRLSGPEALAALRAAGALVGHRYPHLGSLGELAWRWRHDLSSYDALHVALATSLGVTLLTADLRLCAAPGLPCVVELVQRGRFPSSSAAGGAASTSSHWLRLDPQSGGAPRRG